MEQEKLDEAQKFLEEDKEKFDKLMNDTEKLKKSSLDEAKAKALEKQKLQKQIEDLNAKIIQKQGQLIKYDDDLALYKQQKKFLDVLAI